ncbi:MAG: DUF2080 family transposase-associated protein [Desulfarculaceae bacterium]|nr:DUF2080 family transposase-associated protein [Desulfarculaceae bacterium]
MQEKGAAAKAREPRYQPVKFEVYGVEIVEKQVAASGKSGRVYLPMEWLGKRVKIVRVD